MTLTEMLEDARAQYHSLMLGRAVRVLVDQNGERIEYTSANASRLLAYINDLQRQIDGERVSGPMRVFL